MTGKLINFPPTWRQKVEALQQGLGRKPTLDELLALSQTHDMSPAEIKAQQQSWVRGMTTPCEHDELDFEQCPKCREQS